MKIAISLPEKDFNQIEKIRLKLKKNRSEIIQEAIEYWLANNQQKSLIEKYVAGYKRLPEKSPKIKALEKTQVNTFSGDSWS